MSDYTTLIHTLNHAIQHPVHVPYPIRKDIMTTILKMEMEDVDAR